jgi:hypothetical protein
MDQDGGKRLDLDRMPERDAPVADHGAIRCAQASGKQLRAERFLHHKVNALATEVIESAVAHQRKDHLGIING